jgi:ABC-type metal ion transport system substrate-binding protein
MELKKKKYIFISILFVLLLVLPLIVFAKFSNKKNNKKEIKIATALENSRLFLESNLQKELKTDKIDLKVIFQDKGYNYTNKLLLLDEVLAILDSHLPYANHLSKTSNISNERVIVAQPFYLSKIGLYSSPQKEKTKNIKNLKDLQKEINLKKEYKILFPDDPIQRTLFLLFLEQMQLIKLKQNIKKDKDFLKDDFDIPSNLKLIGEENMMSIYGQFQSKNEIDFLLNYPGILLMNRKNLNLIHSLEIPDDINSPIYDYSISLIVKEKNINSEEIKILKDSLRKEEYIQQMDKDHNLYLKMIPIDKMDEIAKNINQKYN